jgi:hypothetical protein
MDTDLEVLLNGVNHPADEGSPLGKLYRFFTFCLPGNAWAGSKGRSALPDLNPIVVFVIRDLADRRGEPDRAGGLLDLPAQAASR